MREVLIRVPVVKHKGVDRYVDPRTGRLLPNAFDLSILDGDWTIEATQEKRSALAVLTWERWAVQQRTGANTKATIADGYDEWTAWLDSKRQVAKARLRILKFRAKAKKTNETPILQWSKACERMGRQIRADVYVVERNKGWGRWIESVRHNSNVRVRGKREHLDEGYSGSAGGTGSQVRVDRN